MCSDLDSFSWELFPCVVVGFKLYGLAEPRLRGMTGLPPWFSLISGHQTGGYACHHHSLAGAVLRLADNQPFLRDPTRLLHGFASMGGDTSVPRRERDLGRLSFTSGDVYQTDKLTSLSGFLDAGGSFPRLKEGHEAMVEFAGEDAWRFFNGWRIHTAAPPPDAATAPLPEHYLSEDHLAQLEIIGELLNDQIREETRWELGGFDAALDGCFLLWMNSD